MSVFRLSRSSEAILDVVRACMGRAADQGQRDIPIAEDGKPTVDTAVFELCVHYMRHRERRARANTGRRARAKACNAPTTTCGAASTLAIPPDSATSPSSTSERQSLYNRALQLIGSPTGPPSAGTAGQEKRAGAMLDVERQLTAGGGG